jgi:hypothetical protein
MDPRSRSAQIYNRISLVVGVLCLVAITIVLATADSSQAAARKIPCSSVSKSLHEKAIPLACRVPSGVLPARPF